MTPTTSSSRPARTASPCCATGAPFPPSLELAPVPLTPACTRAGRCGDWLGTFTGDTGHKGAVWSARLSQDGSLAATGSADFTACVLSLLCRSRPPHHPVRSVRSKVWDTHSGACLVTLPHSHIVRTADLSSTSSAGPLAPSSPTPSSPSSPAPLPSQLRLLTGGHEKRLRLWDLARAPRDGSDADVQDGVDEFRAPGSKTAHAGTVKKVLWDEERQGAVSMGEDRVLRCVSFAHPAAERDR